MTPSSPLRRRRSVRAVRSGRKSRSPAARSTLAREDALGPGKPRMTIEASERDTPALVATSANVGRRAPDGALAVARSGSDCTAVPPLPGVLRVAELALPHRTDPARRA